MKAYCLASSSSGNAFIIEIGGATLLIECGIPLKEIYQKCNEFNIDFSKVCACLITHAHKDHCLSADSIFSHGVSLYASKGTQDRLKAKINILEPLKVCKIVEGVYVLPFEVEHDIEGALGFVIKSKDETIIFINDSKRWNVDLRNFKPDYVFIECNYDNKVVYAQMAQIKKSFESGIDDKELRIRMAQFKRNTNAHQSLNSCIKGLKSLNLTNCKSIFLMHLSDRYANEYKMKNAIENVFKIKTYVCKKKGGIK